MRAEKIEAPTAEDYALAKQVATWMATLAETEQTSDYLYNLGIYGRADMVNMRGIGIVASAPQALNREVAKRQERADYSKSTHVGTVGERLTLRVKLLSVFDSQNDWGATYIHKFIDVEGNLLTWFGSNRLFTLAFDDAGNRLIDEIRLEPGDEFWIKGTVKRFAEFKGIKETHLSRTDVVLNPDEEKRVKAAQKATKAAKAKAVKAARKAFGEPIVIACWHRDVVDYTTYSAQVCSNELAPCSRVLQLSATEFHAQTSVNGVEWGNVDEAAETFEHAERMLSMRGYISFTTKVNLVVQEMQELTA